MIELAHHPVKGATIRVIGVGGGGGNAINNMIRKGLTGVEFIAANTDEQALNHNLAEITVQLGANITRGLGAGADPEIGKKAVEEASEDIKNILKDSDMIFVTSGMGGGTGTGGAPVIAKLAKDLGALVVGIVTKPFTWEGKKRISLAEQGISELRNYVDALIVIPNQKLLDIIDLKTSFMEAFQKVDEVLYNATRGIADIISRHGIVNVDFADVRTVMRGMGDALMGIGVAAGEHRATEATENALNSPLLDGISISGAKGVLVNITGGSNLTMHEVAEAVNIVEQASGGNAMVIHGVVHEDQPNDELMVTVVATGFHKPEPATFTSEQNVNTKGNITIKGNPIPNPFINFGQKIRTNNNNQIGIGIQTTPGTIKTNSTQVDYDTPAYQRKQQTLTTFSQGHSEKSETAQAQIEDVPIFKDYEKPAFLRKIMD